MAHMKNTDRRVSRQGSRARFGVLTGATARRRHYAQWLRLQLNQIPSDSEQSLLHVTDWQSLEPSLSGGISPEVEAEVDRLNAACPVPAVPSPAQSTIGEPLKSLDIHKEARPEEPAAMQGVPVEANVMISSPTRTEESLSLPRSSPITDLIEDLPVPSPAKTVLYQDPTEHPPTMSSETVEEFMVPVAMAKSVVAEPTPSSDMEVEHTIIRVALPRPPTATVKCPRKQFRPRRIQRTEPPLCQKNPKLSALQEICKWQTRVDPLLPLAPFTVLVREAMRNWGDFRITRDAVLALRCGTEQYIVDTLQGVNLLSMHWDHCTLQPKDVRMVHWIRNEDELVLITEEAKEGVQQDFQDYRAKRMSLVEAVQVETERRRKLCIMALNRWEVQRQQVNACTLSQS